jgi:hypothetical protein
MIHPPNIGIFPMYSLNDPPSTQNVTPEEIQKRKKEIFKTPDFWHRLYPVDGATNVLEYNL